MRHIDWRSVFARLPLPLLALAASWGVFQFSSLFVPEWVAIVQASAFECTYLGLAVTRDLATDQRKRATAISVGAVVASIVYNTLAGWFHRQPALLGAASPIAWLMFAILHGAPLAWVAYLVADLLLHSAPAPAFTAARVAHVEEAVQVRLKTTEAIAKRVYECPHCGSELTLGAYGAAKRHGHCRACKENQYDRS